MNYQNRIVADYKVMLGKPVIKGTRITVEVILKKLSEGATVNNLLEIYEHLTEEDVLDVVIAEARKNDKNVPFDEVLKNLKSKGKL